MNEDRAVARNLIIVTAGQIMNALQGVVTLPIMIRYAGEATYGAYVILTNLVTLIFYLLLTTMQYRYVRGLPSALTLADRRRLFEPQFSFLLLSLGLVSLAIVVSSDKLEQGLFQNSAHFAPWLLVATLMSGFLQKQLVDYFRFSQRFLPSTLSSALAPYVFVAMLFSFAAFQHRLSLDGLLVVQTVVNLCMSLPLVPMALREIGVPRLRLPVDEIISNLRIAWPLTVELIIDNLLRFSDRYLITFFLSIAAVARYQPAYALASCPLFFSSVGETVLIPALARLIDKGERPKAQQILDVFLRLFLMIAVPFSVGSLMLGPSLVALLTTPEIGWASRWVTPLVAAGTLCYGVMRTVGIPPYLLAQTRLILGANAFGAVINVGLNLALLPIVGDITVAAATTLIGYAAGAIYTSTVVRHLWRVDFDWNSVLRFGIAAIVMGGTLWALGYRPAEVSTIGPMGVGAAIGVGVLSYFLSLALVGGFGRRELNQLAGLVRRRFPDADA